MNYREFLNEIDKKLLEMSEQEKTHLLHEFARITKEENREAFLKIMEKQNKIEAKTYENQLNDIYNWFSKIDNKKIYFECTGDEVYDDYHHGEWVYEYNDKFNIGNTLESFLHIAENLLYERNYKEACKLYSIICMTLYPAIDIIFEETNQLTFKELHEENIIKVNLKHIAINLLYCQYKASPEERRVENIYECFHCNMFNNIHIDEIFSAGPEEIIEIDDFIEEWLEYLKNTDEKLATELLSDILDSYYDMNKLCETAKETMEIHPAISLTYCKKLLENEDFETIINFGKEVLAKMNPDIEIRSKILNIAAFAAEKLNDTTMKSKFSMGAFYSESSILNYIKLFDTDNYKKYSEAGILYIDTLPEKNYEITYDRNFEKLKNTISKERKSILHFFNMEFEQIQQIYDNTPFEWINGIKERIVSLFLLMLDKRPYYSKAGKRLIEDIQHYRFSTTESYDKSFEEYFLIWKDKINLPQQEYDKYISWCEKQVEKRVYDITSKKNRGLYYKAAELLVQMGEVLESNGKANGKLLTVNHYKQINSRKSAFKAEIDKLL